MEADIFPCRACKRMTVAQPHRRQLWPGDSGRCAIASRPEIRSFASRPVLAYGRTVTVPTDPVTPLGEEFIRNRPVLERYLRSRGSGSHSEDLIQELWIKVAALPAGIEVNDPSSYLFRMAHNLMLDRRRNELRRGAREQQFAEVGDLMGDPIDPAPSPERAFDARRRLEAIEAVLRGLGERTDYIFRRHRVEGVPQRDIAAELGISLSAVEKHLQKAYKAVHVAYREGGEHEFA